MDRTRRLNSPLAAMLALLVAASLLAAAPLAASLVVSCPFAALGDNVTEGIVVQGYSGTNVRLVQLAYSADNAGLFAITLAIRRGTFNGPLVGARTLWVNVASASFTDVIFDFGGAPVTPGDTLTFTHSFSSSVSGRLFFDAGAGSLGSTGTCGGGAYETEGTTPPLSTERRNTVGINMTQDDLGIAACVPSDTVLCIDNNPGDRRFAVSVAFSHPPSIPSGNGQAVPMSSLGVTSGGAFWFFGQNNPEILIKILNGCGINGKFWVFFDAGTNVAFTVHVLDTVFGLSHDYSNTDNHAAAPVEDVNALPCVIVI
ncbi:MAG TPA: hypothetical protein VHR45_19365 [Thermoanaerobaculia bacterium]|nr:hypothetical protein [Thermoanaerobaculia bacterium]